MQKCAVPPSILYGQNINAASSFNFPSGFLRPVGIEVAKHPMEVVSRKLLFDLAIVENLLFTKISADLYAFLNR